LKFGFIKKHQQEFPIKKMCQVLQVSRGGYYRWLKHPISSRKKKDQMLLEHIKRIHKASEQTYGSPRITDQLHDEGVKVSRSHVAQMMKKLGIKAIPKRKFKVTTNSNHSFPISPNLLKRDFSADQPGKVWTSDITYVQTSEGWLYLTVIMDLFNREIVGWAMSGSMRASETTIAALKSAITRFHPEPDLIFHSDRGIQYACNDFREQLNAYQMNQSMSGLGNCYDNAVTESFFATLKKERVYRCYYKTRFHARQSIFQYIEVFYNRIRKHSFLGNVPPVQFRTMKMAA